MCSEAVVEGINEVELTGGGTEMKVKIRECIFILLKLFKMTGTIYI